MKIAVGFLVAYDFEYLKISLPLIYEEATFIVLGLDKNRLSFSGHPFLIDPAIFEWVEAMDHQKKVIWQQAAFYKEGFTPMQVETTTRNKLFEVLPQLMDWYLQLDSDEYLLDFKGLKAWLDTAPVAACNAVRLYWKTLFKQHRHGYFVVGSATETFPALSRLPYYEVARIPKGADTLTGPFFVLHQSWARNKKEIEQKIKNWGHKDDLNWQGFLDKWDKCNTLNFRYYRYFHPMHAPLWPYLEFIPLPTVEKLITHYQKNVPGPSNVPALPLWYRVYCKVFKPQ